MNQYTIAVKSVDNHGDPDFYQVDAIRARRITDDWNAHRNIEIGDKIIPWNRIIEITAPPKNVRLEGPKWCGKCEEGWVMYNSLKSGEQCHICTETGLKSCRVHNTWGPCVCNAKGIEICKEYKIYLESQSWYRQANNMDEKRLDTDSLLRTVDETFGTTAQPEQKEQVSLEV